MKRENIMNNLNNLTTEQTNSRTMDLDAMPVIEALKVMNEEDAKVAEAVKEQLPNIEKTIHAVIEAFNKGGRLIYIGAGTSGRLGLLDAVECPPTFGTPPEMVVALLAGGVNAFTQAVEDAEDSETLGVEDLKSIHLTPDDVVIGITASGRTPYVVSALKYASELGCKTAAIACTKPSLIGQIADIAIEVVVGPEVLTGSTRLKAGTAQKMVLNMISTLSMVGIGKVYKNLMVDVQMTNQKLRTRAENIIMGATGVNRETADRTLQAAGGSVKLAIVMIRLGLDAQAASDLLRSVNGHVRKAIETK